MKYQSDCNFILYVDTSSISNYIVDQNNTTLIKWVKKSQL